jgi:hypothetical protein
MVFAPELVDELRCLALRDSLEARDVLEQAEHRVGELSIPGAIQIPR